MLLALVRADDVVVPSVFVTTNTGNSLPGSLIMLNATVRPYSPRCSTPRVKRFCKPGHT